MTIAIRALQRRDAAACDEIVRSLPYHFGDAGGREQCARDVRTSQGLVAVEDGAVVGFLTLCHRFPETSEVTWMAVHADHRRGGVGRAMIAELRARLRAEGRKLLILFTVSDIEDERHVADGYAGTRAFYRAVGFIPARDFPDLWPGNPALLLVLPLGEACTV